MSSIDSPGIEQDGMGQGSKVFRGIGREGLG